MSRIGLVADTHHPEFLESLPEALFTTLAEAGVDLILHAGDVGGPETLDQLARVAPVRAVRGDHDGGLDLPVELIVEVEGRSPLWAPSASATSGPMPASDTGYGVVIRRPT
jgi:putative phosphoesterase